MCLQRWLREVLNEYAKVTRISFVIWLCTAVCFQGTQTLRVGGWWWKGEELDHGHCGDDTAVTQSLPRCTTLYKSHVSMAPGAGRIRVGAVTSTELNSSPLWNGALVTVCRRCGINCCSTEHQGVVSATSAHPSRHHGCIFAVCLSVPLSSDLCIFVV